MKKTISKFEKMQEDAMGFVRYVIRGSKDGYAVDVYTSTGLLIKTKLSYQSEEAIKEFIDKHTICFTDMIEED